MLYQGGNKMIVKIGDTVECEFCEGKLVACTKKWAIVRNEDGEEYAIYLPKNYLSIPAEIEDEQSEIDSIEIED